MNGCPKHQAGGTRATVTAECICEPVTEKERIEAAMRSTGLGVSDMQVDATFAEVERIVRERMAQAWDEGYETAQRDIYLSSGHGETPNPHHVIPPGSSSID